MTHTVNLLTLEACEPSWQVLKTNLYRKFVLKHGILVGELFQSAFAAETLPRAWPEKSIAF